MADSLLQSRRVLVLIGAQGAGKSTFAQALIQGARLRWHRVNQDTISRRELLPPELEGWDIATGPPREQCVRLTRAVLELGHCCVIDRCNVIESQRADFLSCAASLGCQAHAVVFMLDSNTCATRASQRQEHEGGLQGAGARISSFKSSKQLREHGLPTQKEGFASVMVCESDEQVKQALQAWQQYDGSGTFPTKLAPKQPRSLASFWGGSGKAVSSPVKTQSAAAAALQPALAPGSSAPALVLPADSQQAAVPARKKQRTDEASTTSPPTRDAFTQLMAAPQTKPAAKPALSAKPAAKAPWSGASDLVNIARDPARYAPEAYKVQDDCLLVLDKWPKFRLHALVIARDLTLHGPSDLTPDHLPLLQSMEDLGRQWLQSKGVRADNPLAVLGFHAVPSMAQLHLHVMCQDVATPGLKTKKHWHSFTSGFLITTAAAQADLQKHGRVRISASADDLLKGPLACHRCEQMCRDMPTLRRHIDACKQLPCS